MNLVYDGQSNVLLILFFTTNSLSKWRKSGSDLFFGCGDKPTIKHLFKVYHLMQRGLVLNIHNYHIWNSRLFYTAKYQSHQIFYQI